MRFEAVASPPALPSRGPARRSSSLLTLARTLRVAADDLDLVRVDDVAAVVELELYVLDEEGPDLVAETVGIERALYTHTKSSLSACSLYRPESMPNSVGRVWIPPETALTLNVSRDLTFSCSTSAMARSKFARIFIASWGSMRVSVMRSSRVSVSVAPMLFKRRAHLPLARLEREEATTAKCTCFGGTAHSIAVRQTPSCLVVACVSLGGGVVEGRDSLLSPGCKKVVLYELLTTEYACYDRMALAAWG